MNKSSIISIIGKSNSGKTTLIEKLIKHFTQKGYKISIIKHTDYNFEIDREGKDSYKFKNAGASSVLLTNDRKYALISDIDHPVSPPEFANLYLHKKSDLVIIEGFKEYDTPKIEVIGDSKEPPLFSTGIKNVFALISDNNLNSKLPQFSRNDIVRIGNFIEENFIKA